MVASQNIVAVSRLDEFVAEYDRRGGIQHLDCVGNIANFQLVFDTIIDVTIDPFRMPISQARLRCMRK